LSTSLATPPGHGAEPAATEFADSDVLSEHVSGVSGQRLGLFGRQRGGVQGLDAIRPAAAESTIAWPGLRLKGLFLAEYDYLRRSVNSLVISDFEEPFQEASVESDFSVDSYEAEAETR